MFCFNVIVFYCLLFQGFPLGGKLSALRVAVSRLPLGGKLSALRVAVSRLPLGGKLSALRTDEGRLFCINPSSVAYATPSPTGEGLLPFRHSEAYCPSVILRLAEESNPFRSFADAQDDNETLNFAQDDSKKLSALRVAVSRLPLGGKLSALRTDEGNNLPCPSSVAYATPSPTGEGLLPFRHSEACRRI